MLTDLMRWSFIWATKVPSRSPKSTYGCSRLNSSADTEGKFTAFLIKPSFRKSRSASAVSSPTSSWPSRVDAAMWRGDDLRQLLQPLVYRGFLLEDVKAGSSDLAGLDRVGECLLVHEIAARGVDDAQTFPGPGQTLGVHQLARLRIRRHVQRQKVGSHEQVVERHELHAEIRGDLFRNERIVRDEPHAERRRTPGDFLTDAKIGRAHV